MNRPLKRTLISVAVSFACAHIGMEWRVNNGLQYAS